MIQWRREPFRVFFPLGLALGVAGMFPWILFGRGYLHAWPGLTHSLTMTQAFLVALAVGFLGTMLPRRAKSAPLSVVELGVLAAALIAVPFAVHRGSLLGAELAFLIVLATLGQYVVRAFRRANADAARPMPPSFVLVPMSVALGSLGAGMLIAFDLEAAGPWAFLLGRQLAQQGLMLGLLLALAPMLAPILAHGSLPDDAPRGRTARARALHALAGLVFAASFPVELWLSPRLGLLLRAIVCALELVVAGGLLRAGTRTGLHRWLFRFALWSVPLGLLAAAVAPDRRVQLLHVTYVGGLSLVAFAVSTHVTLLHTGAVELADGRPALVGVAALLMGAAALARVGAEGAPEHYFGLLVFAAGCWIASAAVWAVFLAPRLWSRRAP